MKESLKEGQNYSVIVFKTEEVLDAKNPIVTHDKIEFAKWDGKSFIINNKKVQTKESAFLNKSGLFAVPYKII